MDAGLETIPGGSLLNSRGSIKVENINSTRSTLAGCIPDGGKVSTMVANACCSGKIVEGSSTPYSTDYWMNYAICAPSPPIYFTMLCNDESVSVRGLESNTITVNILPPLPTSRTVLVKGWPYECIPDGGVDDVRGLTSCCSLGAVKGSIQCEIPSDYDTTWESCTQICEGQATQSLYDAFLRWLLGKTN